VSEQSGKPTRKLPERRDALVVPLPFEDAIKAAVETRPPPKAPTAKKKKRKPR
jgi:hypothetical protein